MYDNELLQVFREKLELDKLACEKQEEFYARIIKYLQHNHNLTIKGRTTDYVSGKLDKFIEITNIIGLSREEQIHVIKSLPSILNTIDSFYLKYLILGVLEDETNTVRKNKLVNKTNDFVVGLQQIYSRYKLICESGYNNFSWNALVHASKKEFASIFVASAYKKPYQLFESEQGVLNWLDSVDIAEIDIDSFKTMDVNRELVERYEKKEKNR